MDKKDQRTSAIEEFEWFFGNISRKKAQLLLVAPVNGNGSFLVRQNGETYYISIRKNGLRRIEHRAIIHTEYGYQVNHERQLFDSINEIVKYYKENTFLNGLGPLTKCCVHVDSWEIERRELQINGVIGEGYFARVYDGTWNNKTPVAVKILKKVVRNPYEFVAEVQALKQLRHRKIIRLYAMVTLTEPFVLVYQLATHGSLFSIFENYVVYLGAKLSAFKQIAEGMTYLEECGFVHRDLTSRNVLVTAINPIKIKITDIGLARLLTNESHKRSQQSYLAPETARSSYFTPMSDVWSFGVLMCEVYNDGVESYNNMKPHEILSRVENGFRPPPPKECSQFMYREVLLHCWKFDPESRPTFAELVTLIESEIKIVG